MRVTAKFNLGLTSAQVDFLDVDVFEDNRLFVDPAAIAIAAAAGDPWARSADKRICDFFDFILKCLPAPKLHTVGEEALSQFHEPRETRLGMSKSGFDGAGTGPELGQRMWKALLGNPLCTVGVALLKRVEDIALFVDDVSNDRISDLTTRIIVEDLIQFTQDQMKLYPGLAASSAKHTIQVWDPLGTAWTTMRADLPHVSRPGHTDKPLLLVPKRAAHIGLRMSPRGFWGIEAITAIQKDEAWVDGANKTKLPTKKSIKSRPAVKDIRPTNAKETLRIWQRDKKSLVESYRAYVASKYAPLTNSQIKAKTGG
ncbi:hypothetical protein [Paenarthrobacter nitroguajacolicus]|uniref:hypothetical protein n=1 Tax=Paenarthrobacter nitroguajacolicus TaxID=211146 RepID=UPI000A874EC5|nr:hypothetical protein [Paenarthrobacter nitroguajacolicus]